VIRPPCRRASSASSNCSKRIPERLRVREILGAFLNCANPFAADCSAFCGFLMGALLCTLPTAFEFGPRTFPKRAYEKIKLQHKSLLAIKLNSSSQIYFIIQSQLNNTIEKIFHWENVPDQKY
jgi:hypothetical protein